MIYLTQLLIAALLPACFSFLKMAAAGRAKASRPPPGQGGPGYERQRGEFRQGSSESGGLVSVSGPEHPGLFLDRACRQLQYRGSLPGDEIGKQNDCAV